MSTTIYNNANEKTPPIYYLISSKTWRKTCGKTFSICSPRKCIEKYSELRQTKKNGSEFIENCHRAENILFLCDEKINANDKNCRLLLNI